jgi:hypothetical protein
MDYEHGTARVLYFSTLAFLYVLCSIGFTLENENCKSSTCNVFKGIITNILIVYGGHWDDRQKCMVEAFERIAL